MKKHAIIPVFLPQEGCPNDCIFCNQKKITARIRPLEREAVCRMADTYLETMSERGVQTAEMAFFGGSFTGMPLEKQREYLEIALKYKRQGQIQKIRLSTRPDYISEEILSFLQDYEVDIIELGVQSFDDDVLRLARRGHDSAAVYKSVALIKEYPFTLGLQLMTGLPGDSAEQSIESARKAAALAPQMARIYPTLVIEETELADLCRQGLYKPWSLEESVTCVAKMYRILHAAHVQILRIGLKSTERICDTGDIVAGACHPAFRQLVEGRIAREDIEAQISPDGQICVYSNARSFSNMIGHKGVNKKYFQNCCPNGHIQYKVDDRLLDGVYEVREEV